MIKPKAKMKTVVKWMKFCLYHNCDDAHAEKCPWHDYAFCNQSLAADGLYYLQQALEKSTKSGKGEKKND